VDEIKMDKNFCGIGISVVPCLPKAVKGVRLPYPALQTLLAGGTFAGVSCDKPPVSSLFDNDLYSR
jgi:hypothetical protein